MEDYRSGPYVAGRGTKVTSLPGGINDRRKIVDKFYIVEYEPDYLADLKYFNNKPSISLKIPASYLALDVDKPE